MPNLKNIASEMLRSDSNSWSLFPLYLISMLYGGIIHLRNRSYDSGLFTVKKLDKKVIGVGNITVGGTGKTPMVIMLAKFLKDKGYSPAILSRGYGGKQKKQVNIISDGEKVYINYQQAGDEPVLIAKSVRDIPVITGKNRYQTGRYAIDHFGTDILILDDAFQHRALFRDIDIVLLDDEKPFGNGFVIPRGELRETVDALRRADIIVRTGIGEQRSGDREIGIRGHESGPPIFQACRRPVSLIGGEAGDASSLDYLYGKKIIAFAGIARPDSFKKTIESVGGEVIVFLSFPDHHVYTQGDLIKIRKEASQCSAQVILTTEKDGIKLIDYSDFLRDIYLLRIEMEVSTSRGEFEDIVLKKLEI
ncbi:MAG: tetraacyldisaccharide 4'-kinase [Thermodesulfobacteriota bacterium]|nr:tetraacyldisaccharide 4'-kinase [Thermodesulfobacteriota bacterium]